MNTTLVINPKGGSGKTTVTVNLASYFAAANVPSAILDYDPQGSSLNWLRLRPQHARPIHGASGVPPRTNLRSIAMHVPAETRELVIDAPAAACGLPLQEMLARASCIVVPVPPSAIDVHATANFMRDVLSTSTMRARGIPVAVVANKVRRTMPGAEALQQLLAAFGLELTARLLDSDVFIKAAEAGVGIFEMDPAFSIAERRQFLPLAQWVERRGVESRGGEQSGSEVYRLGRARFA